MNLEFYQKSSFNNGIISKHKWKKLYKEKNVFIIQNFFFNDLKNIFLHSFCVQDRISAGLDGSLVTSSLKSIKCQNLKKKRKVGEKK